MVPFERLGTVGTVFYSHSIVTKAFDDMFSRLDTIPACDRRTDRQTDRHLATA